MSNGNITRRGERSFRFKIELDRDPETGKRRNHLETVRGERNESVREVRRRANARLVELLDQINKGEHVERSAATVEGYIRSWLAAPPGISPKTAERYRQLAEQQIYPHFGKIPLQKLTSAHIQNWHTTLLASGGKNGRPLHPTTVGHAHRLLHSALARAQRGQLVFRNVASVEKPPKVDDKEVASLTAKQIGEVLGKLLEHPFRPIVVVALGTGLRRGEILALQWGNVDLDAAKLRVERSIEETKSGLRFKAPKSKHGRRSVSLPPSVIDVLREHKRRQLETRLAIGLGRPLDDSLVFCQPDGSAMRPDKLSRDWANLVISRKLPRVPFHGLRHSHVSALIAGGLDVFSVSRRIGHSSPAMTLRIYSHMFTEKDSQAIEAIEAVLRTGVER